MKTNFYGERGTIRLAKQISVSPLDWEQIKKKYADYCELCKVRKVRAVSRSSYIVQCVLYVRVCEGVNNFE